MSPSWRRSTEISRRSTIFLFSLRIITDGPTILSHYRLEKITKAETQLAQGKVLDEEQKILLSSKKAIEKSVAEILNIKQQLEEVAKAEVIFLELCLNTFFP